MKARRHHTTPRLNRDAERLAWLARGLAESASRSEDGWWEAELVGQIQRLLANGQEDALGHALDRLQETHGQAYDELADLIEAGVEVSLIETPDGPRHTVLLVLPILAWSRYSIPARKLPADLLDTLRVQLKAHVLAAGCRVGLADFLYSPDQMPNGYVETRRLAARLAHAASDDADLGIATGRMPETGHYISDLRFILAAVSAPPGMPILRWQETDGSRDTALTQWQAQAAPGLQAILPGCHLQLLLPDTFFAAWRRADRDSRGYALTATAAYLQVTLDLSASAFKAVAAPYYEHRLLEWRIGFSRIDDEQVLHGVVWPLLGSDDEGSDSAAEIEALLKQAGIGEVVMLDQRMAVEYCDDCGAPLFPTPDGESVHADMADTEADLPPVHLH